MTDPDSKPPSPKTRTYSGIPAEERMRMRRERLLEAALEVFGTVGYAQTTMRNICVKARLAERYFYESFESTHAVFEELNADQVRKLIAAIGKGLASAPKSDREFIEAGLRAFLEFIREDPRRVQIVLIDGVWMEQLKTREGQSELLNYQAVIKNLTKGFHPHLSPEIDVEMAASGLIGLAIHTAIEWARHGFKADIESVVKHNMYAWGGLGHWVKLAEGKSSTRVERRAYARNAFKSDDPLPT